MPGTGADGIAVERDLIAGGFPVESADRDVVIAVVTMADTAGTVSAYVDALIAAITRHRGPARDPAGMGTYQVEPDLARSPRQAYFAATRTVARQEAIGEVSAELVAPYPPGIPVLAPGERITPQSLATLDAAVRAGVRVAYAADPSLRTVRVVRT